LFPHLLLALRQETESLDNVLKGLAAMGTVLLAGDAAPYWRGSEAEVRSVLQSLREVWGGKESVVLDCLVEVNKAMDLS
jgi:hypothetical protein